MSDKKGDGSAEEADQSEAQGDEKKEKKRCEFSFYLFEINICYIDREICSV